MMKPNTNSNRRDGANRENYDYLIILHICGSSDDLRNRIMLSDDIIMMNIH